MTDIEVFITGHLILRQVGLGDDNEVFALRTDEEVSKYLDRPKATTIDEARQFIRKINDGVARDEWISWAIVPKDGGPLVGTICIWNISKEQSKAEVGYELMPTYQGRGIMREALAEVVKYGFETMGLRTVEAYTSPNNAKSIRLLERAGFTRKADLKEAKLAGNDG